jgi:branched-chain amino acid transport system permease protein
VQQLLQSLILGLLLGGVFALAASGLTLIYGVMHVINIAHGALLILAAFVTWSIWTATGLDPLLIILLTTPLMFVVGLVLYLTTMRPIEGAPPSAAVILTFALAILIEGLIGFAWGNTSHSVRPEYFTEAFHVGDLYFPKGQVFGAIAAIVMLVSLYLFLTRSWHGRAIRAAAEDAQAAALVGITFTTVAALTFAIGVATTGTAGSIISTLYPFLPGSHVEWIAVLLAIIVLGGMGSIPGAVIGALVIGLAETLTSVYISVAWTTAVPFVVIFVVLLFRPQGIMGVKLREDVA